jgi:reverse transcriptase-like protein
MRKLAPTSLDWSLEHLRKNSDTDKFPAPFELDVIVRRWLPFRERLASLDLSQHHWQGQRKMLVPKDQYSFRNAAQLDPVDALLFAGLIYDVGALIERKRESIASKRVFSYRFAPTTDGQLYAPDQWDDFWRVSIQRASTKPYVLVVDITDFYNQISHHSIDNQLERCGLEKTDVRVLMNLLKAFTDSISKGIPVGPHPAHLLAEVSLLPIDELLVQRGFEFCRYVDDVHVFCDSAEDAQVALFALAGVLDQYHKLTLNRQKTRIMESAVFRPMAQSKADDQPINSTEASILRVIKRYSKGPYVEISVSQLSPADLVLLSQGAIESILKAYLAVPDRDYVRMRFLLRRLAQVGVPGAVEFLVHNIAEFLPAFSEVVRYLHSARSQYAGSWATLGDALLRLLESPIAKESEYIQLVLLGLFARVVELDHIGALTSRFGFSGPSAQREIVLAATAAGADSWLRMQKTNFSRYDPWMRRAFAYSMRAFPRDERERWSKLVKPTCSAMEIEILQDSEQMGV